MRVVRFMHRVQNTAVHRFEAVAQIRDGAADNHGHRIIQVRGFQLACD